MSLSKPTFAIGLSFGVFNGLPGRGLYLCLLPERQFIFDHVAH